MSSYTRALPLLAAAFVAAACSDSPQGLPAPAAQPLASVAGAAALGEMLYQDVNLSVNRNQSCRTCHQPTRGFADAYLGVPRMGSAIQGSVAGRFGARKPPTAAYATFTPMFAAGGKAVGGLFWDGRATGAVLGTPAADQAMGPFLNPVEQGLPDAACVVWAVRNSAYVGLYTAEYGSEILAIEFPATTATTCATPVEAAGEYVALSPTDRARVATAFANVARAVAAFEATFNRFSSRADVGPLTDLELEGQALFNGKAKCQQCHLSSGTPRLFTDFRFHNLGVPRDPMNIAFNYATGAADPGLGGFTGRAGDMGRFRTPTTRNVGMGTRRTYMHNGVFKRLQQVVDFYNTRDVLRRCTAEEVATLDPAQYGSFDPDGTGPLTAAGCWPAPETPVNLDTKQMGRLGLTTRQVNAIVAYLRAMNDQ